ncbi:hypothetical protein P4O66_003648 [Electrophorus voltai]|uniref:Armadillo repeat-containing domain-containing protein n=1 Tax=Electrophorus voltai TaxID=2609070 RepID=A0AAD8ZU38_9TELE|nr:hypothetical protein P4O66_003648 [Electrophorus voltai]
MHLVIVVVVIVIVIVVIVVVVIVVVIKREAEYDYECMTGSDATDVFWNSEVLPVLQEFEAIATGGNVSEETVEHLCDACTGLHNALAEKGLLGKQLRKRPSLIRALFRLIDLGSDKLNLTLAKFTLACEDVYSSGEAVLYSVGSLKLLSGNSDLSRLLLAKDFIRVLLQLSQRLMGPTDLNAPPDPGCTEARVGQPAMAGHILVQLTAALRNMADRSESRSAFLSNGIFPTLCTVMDLHQDDRDICLNVARIFSKLSSYAECCSALAETPLCYRLFLDMLSKHSRKQDLVVRLLFTLGNLAARSSAARGRVYEEAGSIDILLGLFQSYKQATVASKSPKLLQIHVHQDEEVLVKLIRVLANLAIHPAVGIALAANELCVQLLLDVMEVTTVEEKTELVINASATINNLSYYQGESSVVRAQHTHISELLLRLLLSSNMDAVLEAMRVFGNLSQIKYVRHFIIKNKVHCFVVTLLDSKNPNVCFSACGVLMNLSADPENRSILSKEGAVHK